MTGAKTFHARATNGATSRRLFGLSAVARIASPETAQRYKALRAAALLAIVAEDKAAGMRRSQRELADEATRRANEALNA